MLKRCFSLILAFAMVFSLLPVQALAEGAPEAEGEVLIQETQVHEADPEPETEPAPVETEPVTEPAPAETEPVPVETEPVTEPATEPEMMPKVLSMTECSHSWELGICSLCGAECDHYYDWWTNHFQCMYCGLCLTEDWWHELPASTELQVVKFTCSTENDTAWMSGWDVKRLSNIVEHANGNVTCDATLTAIQFEMFPKAVKSDFDEKHGRTHTDFAGLPTSDITIPLTWDAAAGVWTCETIEYFCTCEGQAAEPESDSVTFTFNVIGQTDVIAPITVALGEFIELPNCTYENPGFTFNGWILNRSDGAMLSIYGTFVTDGNDIATVNAGTMFEVDPNLFDPATYNYNFSAGWCRNSNEDTLFIFSPDATDNHNDGYLKQPGETFVIPACTYENPGNTFAGWYLHDPFGAWMTENGTFTTDESVPARRFLAGESFTVDASLFNGDRAYTFQAVWSDAVVFLSEDFNSSTILHYYEDIVFPVSEEVEAAGQSLSWAIQRSDGKFLTGNDSYQDITDLHDAWINPAGGLLTVHPNIFDGTKYTYNFVSLIEEDNGGTNEGGSAYVSDEAGLRGAIDACFEHIWIDADITLTDVLTIPEGIALHIDSGTTLTVPANVVLNVYGHLYVNNGMLKIEEGGIMRTFGASARINVGSEGKIYALGADLSGVGTISVMYRSPDQIVGVPANILEANVRINSFAEMKEMAALAGNFRLLSLELSGDITITEDLDLPRNVALHLMNSYIWDEEVQDSIAVPANVTVAPGVTLTANSYFGIYNECTLTVSEGACLNSFGYLGIYSDARVVNNGTITAADFDIYEGAVFEGNEIMPYEGSGDESGLTEEQLREALSFEASEDRTHRVRLSSDITLTGDLTIPKYHEVYVESGATLTVPAGITLTLEGDLYIDGTVKVAPGAHICTVDNNWCWLGIWCGTLDLTGANISGLDFERVDVDFSSNGQILGVPASSINGRFEIHNFEELKAAALQAPMYRHLDFNIHETVNVTEDLEIPANVSIFLWSSYGYNGTRIPAELVVASGVNMIHNGSLQVGNDSVLNIAENAQLTVLDNLHVNSSAKIVNYGTIYYTYFNFDYGYSYEGSGQMIRQKAPGMTEEQLRAALNGEDTWVLFTGEITLTDDLVIPQYYELSMQEGASITVPEGLSLIVEGSLYIGDGTVKVNPGASFVTIDNDSLWISVGYNGHLDLTGADLTNADVSRINLELAGSGTVSGIPSTAYQASARVETLDDVRTYLAMASQYHHLNVSLVGNVTVTEDLKIPSNAGLQINWEWRWDNNTQTEYKAFGNVTVAPGVKLENRGHIYIENECTLTVSEGSELYCSGSMYIGSNGTLINDGIIHERNISYDSDAIILGNGQWIPYETPPMTEDELHEELRNNGVYLDLTGNMTLTRDLTIPDNDMLELVKGAVLTVPAGITLTIDGYLYISNGMLKIEEGGILKVTGPGNPQVGIFDNGVLDATGADVSGVNSGTVYFWLPYTGNIHGIPAEKLTAADDVTSYTSLVNTLAEAENYHAVYAECEKSMTISKDIYIPENAIVEIYPTYSNTGKVTPTKITVSSGASVFNDGVIFMADNATLTINSGCELYNGDGVLEVGPGATLVNNGTVTAQSEYYHIADGATVKGTGKLRVIEELTEISSVDKIMEAYMNGATVLRIVNSNIEITESTTLPRDLELEFISSNVTIAEGVTVTCETNRALSFMAGSKLYLNGAIDAKEIFVDDLNGVIPQEKIVSTEKAPVGGWYIKLGIPKVESLTVYVDSEAYTGTPVDVDMKYKPTAQLSITSEPQYSSQIVTWKSSSTSLATVNADGLVTFKKPGAVTITATAADGSKVSTSVKFNVTYLDPAATLTAVAEVPELGLEESYTTTMLVYGTDKENALNPLDLTFTSSNNAIASVDENGIITAGEKAGTATITAAITGDPLGRKVSVKVKVIPLQTEILYLLPQVNPSDLVTLNPGSDEPPKFEFYLDKSHVASGEYTFQVKPVAISTNGNGERVTMDLTDDSLKWTSTDTKVADIEVNDNGSATVTLKSDGATVITATTTDLAPLSWEFFVYVCDKSPRLDTKTVTLNTKMETGVSIPLVESYDNTITGVTVDDERLAVSHDDGMLTVTAPDFIDMKGTIKTKLKVETNEGPYTYDFSVKIANSEPSITVKQPVKFNPYTGLGTDLTFTAKNAEVKDVVLDIASTASFDQAADFIPETGILTLAASDAHLSGEAAMDAKIEVDVYLEGYRDPIRKAVTVATSSTKPSITVKQTEKFNLFYKNWVTVLQVSVKDMEIAHVELAGTDSFEPVGGFDFTNGTLAIKMTDAYRNKEVDLDASAKLLLYPVGYETPIEKTFSIKTATTKPSLAMTPASSTINTKLDSKTTFIAVYDKTYGGMVLSPEDVDITVTKDSKTGVEFATYAVVDGGILLELTGDQGGKATIEVKLPEWTQSIKLTHKVTVKDTMPAPVLGASTLKLNRIFTKATAETTAMLNQSNYDIYDIKFTPVTEGADGIILDYEDGIIYASFDEDMAPANAPKNGNYKFNYVVTLDNEAKTELDKKTITVNVSSTVPTAKLKASTLTLNKNLGTLAAAQTTVSLTKGDGYSLVGMVPKDAISSDIQVEFDAATGTVSAYLMNEAAAAKSHTIYLHPVLYSEKANQTVTLTSTVKLTVAVKAQTISASISTKGKLDTMNPDSNITYTINKLNNIVGEVYDAALVDDMGLFDVKLDTTGSKPVVILTRLLGAVVDTKTTYKLQLQLFVQTDSGSYTVTTKISFKVSQSALKFVTIPTQKLYLFQKELTTTVTLNTPATATLGNITLNSKTAAAFKKAMGDGEVTFELAEDGRSAEVHFAIEHPGYLVNGKSYTVYLDITPADNATNVKPTQLKLTVKAYK